MRTLLRTHLRPMTVDDIAQVAEIERDSFPSMWPQTAYKRELSNRLARYLVISEDIDEVGEAQTVPGLWGTIRRIVGASAAGASSGRLLGFIGVWLMVGEAHIVTIAVAERFRRMGIGERLLIASLELAMDADQEVATLEVRASNDAAQRLYEKYGFLRLGLRKRYYTDNNEDAVIMTTPDLHTGGYHALFADLRARHASEYPDLWG